jgi:steroid delta-isomerase-like uncharacterized protein
MCKENAMSVPNKTLVQRWFDEVWNDKRHAAIDELLAGHSRLHGLGAGPLEGPAAFKPFHAAFVDAFPDIRIHIDELVAEGDKVAARFTCTGTHTGHGLGIPPTNRRATFSGMAMVRVENGLAVEAWNNFDQYGMLQQLGAIPAAAPP